MSGIVPRPSSDRGYPSVLPVCVSICLSVSHRVQATNQTHSMGVNPTSMSNADAFRLLQAGVRFDRQRFADDHAAVTGSLRTLRYGLQSGGLDWLRRSDFVTERSSARRCCWRPRRSW